MIKVAVDVMGGDYAPAETVRGCAEAVNKDPDVFVYAVGKEDEIRAVLSGVSYDASRLEIIHASEVVEMAESPVAAIRAKKDSSMLVGMKLVRDGAADGFVCAGNTGAVLVGGQTVIGRLKGVQRAPLAMLIPTEKGVSLLLDCGANVDARPDHLVSWARMGSVYYETMVGKKSPTVALVSIGTEEEKGNALVKETGPLLKECKDINYTGYIESREIPAGGADVIVCEAFTGNVILKLDEGMAKTMLKIIKGGLMSSLRGKIGGLLIKKPLKETLKTFDASSYGGAPMLGLKGLVVKTHGNSTYKEICNSILQCAEYKRSGADEKIRELESARPYRQLPTAFSFLDRRDFVVLADTDNSIRK